MSEQHRLRHEIRPVSGEYDDERSQYATTARQQPRNRRQSQAQSRYQVRNERNVQFPDPLQTGPQRRSSRSQGQSQGVAADQSQDSGQCQSRQPSNEPSQSRGRSQQQQPPSNEPGTYHGRAQESQQHSVQQPSTQPGAYQGKAPQSQQQPSQQPSTAPSAYHGLSQQPPQYQGQRQSRPQSQEQAQRYSTNTDQTSYGAGSETDDPEKALWQAPELDDDIRARDNDKLQIYRELVGITSSQVIKHPGSRAQNDNIRQSSYGPGFHPDFGGTSRAPRRASKQAERPRASTWLHFFTRATSNKGYYKRAVDAEYRASIAYHFSNFIINAIIILQIFIAATFTALSAYGGHKITLTTLGGLNTALAGLQAFAKGLGLPNRMLKSRDQFRHVREYAEDVERQFEFATLSGKPSTLDPWQEKETVRKMYEAARKDEQDNYPDRYTNHNQRAQQANMTSASNSAKTKGGQGMMQQVEQEMGSGGNGGRATSTGPGAKEYLGPMHRPQ